MNGASPHSYLREFVDVLKTFDHAMLVTRRDGELRSRPMALADRTDDGRVWFMTSVDSAKLREITDFPEVNVAMQADSRFLSISGTVRATRDPDRIDELWNDIQELWFPEGRNDPTLILLEVVPTFAEYWDRSGVEAVKFMFAAAKSMATGEVLGDGEGKHGKIRFPSFNEGKPR
jgi:general stress protein 26